MIEKNIITTSGVKNTMTVEQMQLLIKEAGFEPRQRNQLYADI